MRAADRDAAGLGPVRAFGFLAPALVLIGVFLVFPALWTLYIGITDYQLTGPAAVQPQVVGAENFRTALADPLFGNSVRLTALYALCSAVIGQNVLGFALAWLLRPVRPGLRRAVEGLVLLAWVLPGPVVAYLWFAVLSRDGGTLGLLLDRPATAWLVEYPMASLVVFNIWRGTAFSLLLYTSALAAVPPSQVETARLLGANGWQTVRDAVFPHIRGHVLTNTLLISLWTANDFTPFLLTAGGPNHESEVLPVLIYRQALESGQLGYASAISLLLLVGNLLVALVYLRLLRRRA
ncbi:carbohydrate ABC transporter permease [Saccharothrix coeruleofusca]|uniref:Amino acid ABC transporter permease n=1 Tax=Saccharothrix coeruleofusca TaxID=33919 RepID=A0A918AS56_9PSEU|nr:sugar ABC transporter permease [Saccharothrix coeruleofusca]MBP2335936.1 multiple sugar transport system permease protein [Saccharothrix coeruleofusca]GGP76484.1 amino acid ABC transporter permease [Saccharothrix coeruleofusca]